MAHNPTPKYTPSIPEAVQADPAHADTLPTPTDLPAQIRQEVERTNPLLALVRESTEAQTFEEQVIKTTQVLDYLLRQPEMVDLGEIETINVKSVMGGGALAKPDKVEVGFTLVEEETADNRFTAWENNEFVYPVQNNTTHLAYLDIEPGHEMVQGSFNRTLATHVKYPEVVVDLLGDIYQEYNRAFAPAIEKNREWDTDYQYCYINGEPVNYFVQIDMVALPSDFLRLVEQNTWPKEVLKEVLKRRVFELENSLAMYELLRSLHVEDTQNASQSPFAQGQKRTLDVLRAKHGKPVAILAVTDEKYDALMQTEFGKSPDDNISDEEVKARSGFDKIFSPDEFKAYLEANNGDCDYLLYTRSSLPTSKLRKPGLELTTPLLADDQIRRIVKAHSITFNIDNPQAEASNRINDTKEYMAPMGMAFEFGEEKDLLMRDSNGDYSFGDEFMEFIRKQGLTFTDTMFTELHFKPVKESYGAYGHLRGKLSNSGFRKKLRKQIRDRGRYVVQLQMPTLRIHDTNNGDIYTAIHRNFMSIGPNGEPIVMAGMLNMLPADSDEGKKEIVHGNGAAVWGKVDLGQDE